MAYSHSSTRTLCASKAKMIQDLLPPNPRMEPKRKLRGRKRYIRKVLKFAATFGLGNTASDCYGRWHYHPDRHGYGNSGWRMRAPHLEALATIFGRLAELLCHFHKPYQLWIYLDAEHSAQDGIFLYSPNPNSEDFPGVFGEVTWGLPVIEEYFERLIPGHKLRAGHSRWENHDVYFVYAPGVGVSCET